MASANQISNDMRGWILCMVSAVACVFGACVICVDVFVRLIPGQKSFRIQDSNAFLSCSLSLSFGVMIFSALFSMLPSAKRYLVGDLPEQAAGFVMMGAFAVGFVGIQVVSRVIHQFLPSHVVDCDHSHGGPLDEEDGDAHGHDHGHGLGHGHDNDHGHDHVHTPVPMESRHRSLSRRRRPSLHIAVTETTPLLRHADGTAAPPAMSARSYSAHSFAHRQRSAGSRTPRSRTLPRLRRPSMVEVRDRLMSFVKDTKANCDKFGPCYGYSDLCGQECLRHMVRPESLRELFPSRRRSITATDGSTTPASAATPLGPETATHHPPWHPSHEGDIPAVVPEEGNSDGSSAALPEVTRTVRHTKSYTRLHNPTPALQEMRQGDHSEPYFPVSDASDERAANRAAATEGAKDDEGEGEHTNDSSRRHFHDHHSEHGHDYGHYHSRHMLHHVHDHDHGPDHSHEQDHDVGSTDDEHDDHDDHDHDAAELESAMPSPHHHHVPANAFMSIGLQTVLAIGLHKFPEGFITFATNHANPALGFNVFMALFVHNIAEGFAMALPLYMALGSRLRAILWAAALGGLSQPFGAGMAALWLQYLGQHGDGGSRGGHDGEDGNGIAYGVLFAVTAGIMTAVSLQLFVESLTLHHNRQLSLGFAFVGMMLLGLSNALVKH